MRSQPSTQSDRSRTVVRVVAVLGLALSACTAGPIGEADGELVIGTLLPLTGNQTEEGIASREAMDAQLGEIAAANEFDELQIRLVHTDVRSDNGLLPAAIQELDANNVDVVIGPPNNSQDVVTRELLAGIGVVVHLPLSQPAAGQAVMMADALIADGHQLVTLMIPNTTPSEFADALAGRLTENGGTLLSQIEFDPAVERFDPEVVLAAEDESTAVLILGAGSSQSLIDRLEGAGAGPSNRAVYLLGNTAGVQPEVGLRLIEPLAPLADRVSDRLVVAALAAAKAETDDPATVAGSISEVVNGETLCSSFANCLTALRENGSVQFAGKGANGYTDSGEPTEVPYRLTAFTVDGEIDEAASRVITSG
ncbi:MAG: ABC transporter substrate-binding protein [Acidimicrobiales bacterium]